MKKRLTPTEVGRLRGILAGAMIDYDDELDTFQIVGTEPGDTMKQLNVRFPLALIAELDEVCNAIGITQADFVRAAVQNQIKAQRRVLQEDGGGDGNQ